MKAERLVDRFERQNREAAAAILANPQRYAGLPYEWATLWSAKKAAGPPIRPAASITRKVISV